MSLFNVSISNEDRPRVDRALAVFERLTHVLESLVSGKQITIKFEDIKNVNDIRKLDKP